MNVRILAACTAATIAVCLIPSPALGAENTRHALGTRPALPKTAAVLGPISRHPDAEPYGAGSTVTNSGTNQVDFGAFEDGDIIVCTDPLSPTGHAGIFDHRCYTSIYSYGIISANMTPVNGVQREKCIKYRSYDRAYGLWVPSQYGHRFQARDFAAKQLGKPYSVFCSKTDLRSFYCSKVAWVAWRFTAGVDLDGDGGYWVWPIDLVTSANTRIFGLWT
jgi:uncharacterized protein YycO